MDPTDPMSVPDTKYRYLNINGLILIIDMQHGLLYPAQNWLLTICRVVFMALYRAN